ncbi:hypothetical protein TKK_0006343 [Trichogramma kaykai]|uniref:allantoinase n=1 Tax=Trichogramma kaykai TaxID=54128 RepID=A0ABD2XED9_9HYME
MQKIFISKRTILPDGIKPSAILVTNGKIKEIISLDSVEKIFEELKKYEGVAIEDFGNLVLMPGIVDSHVHVSEPGRTKWEGYWTATQAAAAGGVTTIVDMPLNASPPTTTVENLKLKVREAQKKSFVDVAFWGGIVPENQNHLKALVNAGVVGFKSFLHPSGTDDFKHVSNDDVTRAVTELEGCNVVLAFHAERECKAVLENNEEDPYEYATYLKTRPAHMEVDAISFVKDICSIYKCRCHIVHLSAKEGLNLVREAKKQGLPLTVETCFHYLSLTAEQIPRGAVEYKCCPPIRDAHNKEKLWDALKDGTLDMVVSDHSPCTADLKGDGNFLQAWGGISSLQFGLSVLWTEARTRNFSLQDIARVLSASPAKMCGLDNAKGCLKVGVDADFVVWNPEETIEIKKSGIFFKNKVSPYLNKEFYGKVYTTIVRGNVVYQDGKFSNKPLGKLLLPEEFLSTI